jgi:hypothetical protein
MKNASNANLSQLSLALSSIDPNLRPWPKPKQMGHHGLKSPVAVRSTKRNPHPRWLRPGLTGAPHNDLFPVHLTTKSESAIL